jgi:hypothetical protein
MNQLLHNWSANDHGMVLDLQGTALQRVEGA